MAAMREEDSDLASQCMAFCQVLRSKGRKGCKGQKFSFVLNVAFSFSIDTRGDGLSTMLKKKKSPSTVRRKGGHKIVLFRTLS